MRRKKFQKLFESTNPSEKEKFITAELSYPNCDLYAASDETRNVYIWRSGHSKPILTLMYHISPVNKILLNTDEAELYSGLKGGLIVLWDIYNQKVKLNLQGHSTIITAMTIYRTNKSPCALASASAEGKIKLWDLKTKKAATNLKGHFSEINALAFSPDFTYLASGSQDGVVKLWDIRMSNKILKEISSNDQKGINCIEFNPYETCFAYGSKDKTIRYWELDKFHKVGQTTADRLPIQNICFDNKGKNIFSATNEALKYWEISERGGINLIDMFETGWNKLQSFKYIEGEAVCALSTYSNKISYYSLKYEDLFKNPNMLLRENPDMGNISEVQESEDSTFFDNELNLHLNVPNKTKSTKSNNIYNFSKNSNNNKVNNNANSNNIANKSKFSSNNSSKIGDNNNNIGLSRFLNNNEMSNISVSLSDISSSKIENETMFMNNALKMIGPNNYKGPIVHSDHKNKVVNPDDIPLPKPQYLLKNKDENKNYKENKDNKDNNVIKNDEDKNKNDIDEDPAYRLLIGNISNMSDISDENGENKGELTLNTIFGTNTINNLNALIPKTENNTKQNNILPNSNKNTNKNENEKNNNDNENINKKDITDNKEIKDNKEINLDNKEKDDFNIEFGEKDLDYFFGQSIQNKDLNLSEIQSFTTETEDMFLFEAPNTNNPNLKKTISNNNPIKSDSTKDKKITIDDLSTIPNANNNNNINNNPSTTNINTNNMSNNLSFASLKSNETLGIDFSQLLADNGVLNETKQQIVSQSQDLPILQEINEKHDNMRSAITKRLSGIKMVAKWWKDSDIPSTLNALNIMNDASVTKDFFIYAIITRKDISQIPFTLDTGIIVLNHVVTLLKSKIDVYWKTACRTGITFLKIFVEKIESTRISYRNATKMGQTDPILEERMKKCEEIIKIFTNIYKSGYLRIHIRKGDNENNSLAYAFLNDLQFFLKPFDANKIVIRND